MINVIRHGDKRRMVCPECNCIFTYQEEDIERTCKGLNEYEPRVSCPDCGFEIEVLNWMVRK